MAIGTRIRWALEQRKQSIRALHKALQGEGLPHTSYPALHRYLKGESDPSADFVTAVASLLRVRPEWLLTGNGPALEEEWEREQQRDRARAAVEIRERARDPFDDAEFIATLPLGNDELRLARYKALRRFAQRLYDAEGSQAVWGMESDRRALLAAAATFLVAVDAAFLAAGQYGEHGHTNPRGRRGFRRVLLLESSASGGWQVMWTDAILDLFARRVFGLGERAPDTFVDAHDQSGPQPDFSF